MKLTENNFNAKNVLSGTIIFDKNANLIPRNKKYSFLAFHIHISQILGK